MKYIKKIIDKCLDKLNKNYFEIDSKYINEIYYNIFLISYGIKLDTYLELEYTMFIILNNNDDINFKYLSENFEDLREIRNIDYYICKLYDLSLTYDAIYIYYKPKKIKYL
jgi:hypothetical protein